MISLRTPVQHASVLTKELQPVKAGRLQNLDMVKGFLVLLVIVGHTIAAKLHDNILSYILIVFRMPLLIGLSGYLLNYEKIKTYSLPLLFKKYKNRIIIPWVIAVCFFAFFTNIKKLHTFSVRTFSETLISGFVFPYSHLWYIAGLLSWIVFTWMLSNLRAKLIYIVFTAALLSPVLLLFHIGFLEATHPVIKFIVYTIRPFYYFFFIFGVYLKSTSKFADATSWRWPLAVGLGIFLLLLFYFFNPYIYAPLAIVFDALLLILILDIIKREKLPSVKVLEWAGKNSLAVYLWHPIPLLILGSVVGRNKPMLFYSLAIVSEIGFLYASFWLSKVPFIRLYFFGIQSLKS